MWRMPLTYTKKRKNMKKVTLAMLIALNTGLMAVETQNVYIGVDIGSTQVESTDNLSATLLVSPSTKSAVSSNNKSSGNAQTLKIGYHIDPNSRVMAFYQNMSADNAKGSTYGIGYDYLIGENAIKPFIGVFAGHNTLEISSKDSRTNSDVSGMGYGAQVGVNYTFNTNVSFEAGYRYMKLNSDQSATYNDTLYGSSATLTETVKVDKITNLFVGVNYTF